MRAVTEAFVRASGGGLLLPRLIPIGDPELDERIGGALDRIERSPRRPRSTRWSGCCAWPRSLRGEGAAESLRLAADLARTLDALVIEEIAPPRLRDAVVQSDDLAAHWEKSLEQLQLIYEVWPHLLADLGAIDLAERRNRLLRGLADAMAGRSAAWVHRRRRHHHRGAGRRGAARARCAHARRDGGAPRPVAAENLAGCGMGGARSRRAAGAARRPIRNII